jgi:ketosteroid isomerase-like protein
VIHAGRHGELLVTDLQEDTVQNTDIETIRTAYAAFGRGDIPTVLDAMNDDIVWTVPPVDEWGGEFRGKDAVLGFFGQLAQRYGRWNLDTEEFVDAGDRLIVLGHHEFDDGDRIPFAHVWTVRDGRAGAFDEYVDNSAMLRHLVPASVA